MAHYTTHVTSDVIHDGLGVVLIDEKGDIVAEVVWAKCKRGKTDYRFCNETALQIPL